MQGWLYGSSGARVDWISFSSPRVLAGRVFQPDTKPQIAYVCGKHLVLCSLGLDNTILTYFHTTW